MNGILLVDKPSGWTSHDIVARIRSILRQAQSEKPKAQSKTQSALSIQPSAPSAVRRIRVGHAGTLDPLATGLMIILIGSYTKRAQEFLKLDKTYEATMKLGQTSTTGDEEGGKTKIGDRRPGIEEIKKVLGGFVGEIEQTPHAYSAIKVGGKRAYKLARAGKEFKIEPRPVTIYSIENIEYRYPLVSFTAKVSSGTYIRSLAEDIGQKLATGAYLNSLRRTQIDKFSIDSAIEIADLKPENIHKHLQK